jgi:hypothetical protein
MRWEAPVTITPDDKDWTWVIEAQCPECGFDAASTLCTDVADKLRLAAARWHAVLTTRPDVGIRPEPAVWSPLEYGCHVRDVCRIYDARLRRMLEEDGPHYENWDQDRTALDDKYGLQDAETVAEELVIDAARLANRFDSVEAEGWERTGFRSDGAAFTIDTFSRYFLHDIVHHLMDVKS